MVRTSRVRVKFDNSAETVAEVIVRTTSKNLTRDESTEQHDSAVDRVIDAVRRLPFAGYAPLRAVEII